MAFLHHWDDDESVSYEELRDKYMEDVYDDQMASLNEIRMKGQDAEFLTAKEFCDQYGLERD